MEYVDNLPEHLKWKIFFYLRSPSAALLHEEVAFYNQYFNRHLRRRIRRSRVDLEWYVQEFKDRVMWVRTDKHGVVPLIHFYRCLHDASCRAIHILF